ncbi:hypothetical protein A2962_03350 [Candidatus Woesebacteria bacterium RIFCSPLOWO2_01_FULL_39_61]|uniref:Membrane protein 6-pyruvoyl-tetrahydropterin synthase-related domain-containing protein n=1 Tax=Candidatus Woesebacteria bacterium RIFCSPHIGHO2_02_FULL_39_13 TaxID=1802505 RepID=A0A1F7Z432_9BACT|nr:MAG: hypothetical protein A2692_04435 [Candidatus Woesebacteria bacterium RIFCSPHIGHO2_01_FULL_39_95]OGM33859.1 MAG: hypothetical protein A3D01_02720 [Candidatus Woesebacteria bacterium RIFCSPHIGHO2_02_FULL_39_13]OGM39020.1 MAG: hypothetical protein A3E13_04990 [Candidatus Woesebacteria bacterium RIFCSPHIGHO2_12_FULL_40_20]OGM67525.1 MAG: hypothetical protein A2962_03350 [Candidatus Woesebacteria bacterium RIFCSPLOWO2_01_FULL_39_61]OGM72856.1 MAG: hypothetical protein A3H19_05855 [Candidatus
MKIRLFSKDRFLVLLLLILAVPTFSSLLRPGFFPMHDDMQAMRLLQIDKCVKDLQIPCRWVPDMGYGYGYPQFNFYAPMPYYIMEAFHLVGLGFLDSVKAGFIASTIFALVGMYLLGRFLWGKMGGAVSSFLYIYAPYRAVDFYVRGAVGELWALAFLPFIFLYSAKSLEDGKKYKVLFALSLASLLTSHNISALIFIPILLLWFIFLLWYKKDSTSLKLKAKGFNFFTGLFWGFAISAFFVIPAWFEKNFVHIESLLGGYFNYINHFVGVRQLLFENQWGYGTSEVGPYDDILLSVGLIQWLLPLVVLILLLILKRKKSFFLVLFFTLLGWIALFMAHSRSSFIWDKLYFLAILQFPWRFLIIATFLFSLASGSVSLLFKKVTAGYKLTFILLIVIGFMLYRSNFVPRIWIDISDSEKFSGDSWQRQQTISIFDYLPIYAEKPPGSAAPNKPVAIEGRVGSIEGQKGTDWQIWNVEIESETAILQLPLYYFPNWEVFVNGVKTPINYTNKLGLITFFLNQGSHEVKAELRNTPVRVAGNTISIAGVIAVPIYLKKKKKT